MREREGGSWGIGRGMRSEEDFTFSSAGVGFPPALEAPGPSIFTFSSTLPQYFNQVSKYPRIAKLKLHVSRYLASCLNPLDSSNSKGWSNKGETWSVAGNPARYPD